MIDRDKKENTDYTTARITKRTQETVAREAKRCGLKNIEYLDAAVRYFALRGLNPVEVEAREGTLILQQIQRLGDRVFGYMQEEERGLLLPMLEELIHIRLTTERVLRLEEVLLSTYPEEHLRRRKEKVEQFRSQNETAIQRQLREALQTVRGHAPGKKKASKG